MLVKRVITVYDKVRDNLVDEFEIDISLEILKGILGNISDDPDLYKIYPINNQIYQQLVEFVPQIKGIDLRNFHLCYECIEQKYP